ncbi:MAG: phenylalanine--tRNA ligase subunit beta [Chloroflexota bacterium]
MRVPLSWLGEYVDLPMSAEALAQQLTLRGMEVSSVEISGADWTDVIVGRLLDVERHPNADTLWLTTVDVGAGEPLRIVCGAQNLVVGQLVPVARVGAVLPEGRRIERSKIRGVVSDGMLCSAAELALGSDADGIHILGTADELLVGTDLRQHFGEVALDVDVKPNRGDALSMIGLAREIAAFTGGEVRWPDASVEESDDATAAHVSVRIDEPELCPRFAARWFDGIRNGASPDWMQRRLVAAGMRPISAVVDVTNYVMHELGQPQHAYDAAAIPGGEIVVRRGRDGETLETIDHATRRLDERMLVIADRDQAIGLAGIMGGSSTEVGAETSAVILESAVFHGPTVRNTARRLALRSEASMRHEKGIGGDLPRLAADRAAHLLQQITGARVGRGIVDNDPSPKRPRVVRVDIGRMERLLGIPLDGERIGTLLAPLGFETAAAGDGVLDITVPLHRLDAVAPEDIAEEVARSYGYGELPGPVPAPSLPSFRRDPSETRHGVRRVLAGLGLDEIVSHALISRDDLQRSGYDPDDAALVRLANPVSAVHTLLRPVLYPSLLAAMAENARQRRLDPWLFEIGKTYHHQPAAASRPGAESAGTGRVELWHVGIGLLGATAPRAIDQPGRDADVGDLKGIVEALHEALGAPLPAYRPESPEELHPHLHPGRAGRLVDAAGGDYGSIGEVHPRIAAAWGIPGRPVVAAIHLPRLLALAQETELRAVPAAQPVDRDLAVVLDAVTPIGDLLRIIRTAAGPMLVEVRPFDAYRGPQVGEGRVSYAVALRFQPAAAGDEKGVEKAMNKIAGSLRHHLGAEIR